LSARFWPFGINDLSAQALATALDDSGIKWRVLVVSACYSGGFIDYLRNDHTLVITAARWDRNSFGCGHEEAFTYFGRAYFDQALRRETSFVRAFDRARDLVSRREKAEGYVPSEPQIAVGRAIVAKLAEIEKRLFGGRNDPVPMSRGEGPGPVPPS
jgi:hypothetical protein